MNSHRKEFSNSQRHSICTNVLSSFFPLLFYLSHFPLVFFPRLKIFSDDGTALKGEKKEEEEEEEEEKSSYISIWQRRILNSESCFGSTHT